MSQPVDLDWFLESKRNVRRDHFATGNAHRFFDDGCRKAIAPEGGIMGVHSLSDKSPIKNSNFGYADRAFEGAAKYSDWQFIYTFQIPVPK